MSVDPSRPFPFDLFRPPGLSELLQHKDFYDIPPVYGSELKGDMIAWTYYPQGGVARRYQELCRKPSLCEGDSAPLYVEGVPAQLPSYIVAWFVDTLFRSYVCVGAKQEKGFCAVLVGSSEVVAQLEEFFRLSVFMFDVNGFWGPFPDDTPEEVARQAGVLRQHAGQVKSKVAPNDPRLVGRLVRLSRVKPQINSKANF